MRINILSESIHVRTVSIRLPETGEPTGETKEVLDFTIAFGIDRRNFTFDMPPDKAAIIAEIKATEIEILANRQKAESIRNWLKEHNLLEVDTEEL